MPTPVISIVVPVYETSSVLPRCIESILRQDFKDFELILVDDGSKDGSERICDEYKAKDDRIVVIHQENAGISAARNAGIDAAKGTFIAFFDSDDWVADDCLSTLLSPMAPEVALSISKEQQCTQDETRIYPKSNVVDLAVLSEESVSAIAERLRNNWFDHVHSKCFRTAIIKDNSLRFVIIRNTDGNLFCMEDTFFVMSYLEHCRSKTIAFCGKVVYAYVRLMDCSVTRKRRGFFEDRMILYHKMESAFDSLGMLNADVADVIRRRRLDAAIWEIKRIGKDFRRPWTDKRNAVKGVLSHEQIVGATAALYDGTMSEADRRRYGLLMMKSIDWILFKCMMGRIFRGITKRIHAICLCVT